MSPVLIRFASCFIAIATLVVNPAYAERLEQFGIKVIQRHPHPGNPFTQGLFYDKGLVESSGRFNRSYLQRYHPGAFAPARRKAVSGGYFAEGMTKHQGYYYLLTWKAGLLLQYDPDTFEEIDRYQYDGEGWGLTSNGRQLLMSNGTNRIRFFDPHGVTRERHISVTRAGVPVVRLNELEWIDGKIFANIWLQDKAVIINPNNGNVTAEIDLSSLRRELHKDDKVNSINGIGWDANTRRLWVTGKNWPYLFEVELLSKSG